MPQNEFKERFNNELIENVTFAPNIPSFNVFIYLFCQEPDMVQGQFLLGFKFEVYLLQNWLLYQG